MIKKIRKYPLVSILSLGSFALVAGAFVWSFMALESASSGPLILHFNDMEGITSIGSFGSILTMGVLGMIIVFINFFVALELEERDRVLGKIVAGMTLVLAVLLFLGFAAIIKVN